MYATSDIIRDGLQFAWEGAMFGSSIVYICIMEDERKDWTDSMNANVQMLGVIVLVAMGMCVRWELLQLVCYRSAYICAGSCKTPVNDCV